MGDDQWNLCIVKKNAFAGCTFLNVPFTMVFFYLKGIQLIS